MGNLNRQINKHLLNSVVSGDVPAATDPKTSRPLFIHTGLGLALIGNVASEANPPMYVNIKPGTAGTEQVTTLSLAKLYNPSVEEYEFAITIKRKGKNDGFTSEVRDTERIYNYLKTNFATTVAGAFNAADVTDILDTLVDRINADAQLGDNHILTGACVVAALVAAVAGAYSVFSGQVTGMTTDVIVQAVNKGVAGDVTLTADSISTVAELINIWNIAHPTNTVALLSGDGTQVPTADIVLDNGANAVDAYITLTAKDASLLFEVNVDVAYFNKDVLGTPVVAIKPTGTTDEIARIFSVRPDQAGTIVTQPLASTVYAEVEIVYRNEGYDNVSASAFNQREQREVIYVPNGYVDALADPLVAALKLAALTIYKDGVAWTA